MWCNKCQRQINPILAVHFHDTRLPGLTHTQFQRAMWYLRTCSVLPETSILQMYEYCRASRVCNNDCDNNECARNRLLALTQFMSEAQAIRCAGGQ